MTEKKTVRLWKCPRENSRSCKGCYFFRDGGFHCSDDGPSCKGVIFKKEKPEPEFVDVEVDHGE